MSNMFSSVFSFLTIIPSGSHTLEDTAKNMHAFPAIGLLMGFVLGMAALGLYYAGVDQIIAAFLLVAATMLITGLHHTDGLADFADGLMRRGTVSEKLAAMRDVSVGTGGVTAIVLYVTAMVAALSVAGGEIIFWILLFGESSAKFSMVLVASVGLPSKTGSSVNCGSFHCNSSNTWVWMEYSFVSHTAANRPRFEKIPFLYPIMESAVFTALYTNAPGSPKNAK